MVAYDSVFIFLVYGDEENIGGKTLYYIINTIVLCLKKKLCHCLNCTIYRINPNLRYKCCKFVI